MFQLNSAGYFLREDEIVMPVGVNYWPTSCGVELWQQWPADEIQHDLDVVKSLGLNTVRFFLRWQDFAPQAGQYDPRMFERLAQMLQWHRERGLLAHPSLFVGWMSGGIFWPAWKGNRNLFADADVRQRAFDFAREAAQVIAQFSDCVLAIDQGNELCCLPESAAAAPANVISWCAGINAAIRDAFPNALIVSGNEQAQVLNDAGWRFGQQPGTDFYSMHAYPVPAWHSVAFDGMTDPLCQSLLPLYTRIARAHGPTMVQEFGTIVTFGARQQDAYLRAILPACRDAGANGFLWWCLRDIAWRGHPYMKNAFEGTLGLIDAQDRIKPGLEYFVEFAQSLLRDGPPARHDDRDAIGLYLPRHYYPRDNPSNPGNDPREFSRHLVIANHLLQSNGAKVRVVRGDQPLPADVKTLVISSVFVDGDEAAALLAWVRAGGRLIWHAPDPINWGNDYIALLGALPLDYRAPREINVAFAGKQWQLAHHPRNVRMEVQPTTAQVIAQSDDGLPCVLANEVGAGHVVYALPAVEKGIAEVAGDRAARDAWATWFAAMCAV